MTRIFTSPRLGGGRRQACSVQTHSPFYLPGEIPLVLFRSADVAFFPVKCRLALSPTATAND